MVSEKPAKKESDKLKIWREQRIGCRTHLHACRTGCKVDHKSKRDELERVHDERRCVYVGVRSKKTLKTGRTYIYVCGRRLSLKIIKKWKGKDETSALKSHQRRDTSVSLLSSDGLVVRAIGTSKAAHQTWKLLHFSKRDLTKNCIKRFLMSGNGLIASLQADVYSPIGVGPAYVKCVCFEKEI